MYYNMHPRPPSLLTRASFLVAAALWFVLGGSLMFLATAGFTRFDMPRRSLSWSVFVFGLMLVVGACLFVGSALLPHRSSDDDIDRDVHHALIEIDDDEDDDV